MSYLLDVLLCALLGITHGSIYTKYAIITPQHGDNVMECASALSMQNACAGQILNNHCEPMSETWCANPVMGYGLTYLTRRAVREVLEETRMYNCHRILPFVLRTGSVIEIRYTLQPNWRSMEIMFGNSKNQIILDSEMVSNGDLSFKVYDSMYRDEERHKMVNTVGVESVLKFICNSDHFAIYFNGNWAWTYEYRLSSRLIEAIDIIFTNIEGDVNEISFTL